MFQLLRSLLQGKVGLRTKVLYFLLECNQKAGCFDIPLFCAQHSGQTRPVARYRRHPDQGEDNPNRKGVAGNDGVCGGLRGRLEGTLLVILLITKNTHTKVKGGRVTDRAPDTQTCHHVFPQTGLKTGDGVGEVKYFDTEIIMSHYASY